MDSFGKFLNSDTTILVLRALVLIVALVWLLTGFRFLDRKDSSKKDKGERQ